MYEFACFFSFRFGRHFLFVSSSCFFFKPPIVAPFIYYLVSLTLHFVLTNSLNFARISFSVCKQNNLWLNNKRTKHWIKCLQFSFFLCDERQNNSALWTFKPPTNNKHAMNSARKKKQWKLAYEPVLCGIASLTMAWKTIHINVCVSRIWFIFKDGKIYTLRVLVSFTHIPNCRKKKTHTHTMHNEEK